MDDLNGFEEVIRIKEEDLLRRFRYLVKEYHESPDSGKASIVKSVDHILDSKLALDDEKESNKLELTSSHSA